MKTLTIVIALQTAAILVLLYEAFVPGTMSGLAGSVLPGQESMSQAVARSPNPISRREFQLMIRDELASFRASAPAPATVSAPAPISLVVTPAGKVEAPATPDSPFRSPEDVEAMLAVRMQLEKIVATGTLSQAEFEQLEADILKLHSDDRGEMLTELVRAINQGELKPQETVR